MTIISEEIKVTTTGNDAAATGATNSVAGIAGKIHSIYLDYHDDTPATADVTITERVGAVDRQTIHVETNSTTDVLRYPRRAVEDNAENTVTYDGSEEIYEKYAINGQVRVAVAGADALTDAVVVTITYET